MTEFRLHTRIVLGDDALSALAALAGSRVLIVTDAFMATTRLMEQVKEHLGGAEVRVFDRVTPDPSVELVAEGVREFVSFLPQAIVAVGGGSPIDAAKAIHKIALEQGGDRHQLWAIPTTSGTGSEVTSFSVITDTEHERKVALISDDMLPDVAILDVDAVRTVPPAVTADTGIDVLTHVLEGYVSSKANDLTDAVAEKAVQLVFANLRRAHRDGEDLEARARMHSAATLAGMSFDNAGLGICHSIAHAVGAHFHCPHGRANAVVLPHVMAFNAGSLSPTEHTLSTPAQRYAHLARLVGIEAMTDRARAQGLIEAVKQIVADLGIAPRVRDHNIARGPYMAQIPAMVESALADSCTPTNPVAPTAKDLERLFVAIY